jgi:hypothetical protein
VGGAGSQQPGEAKEEEAEDGALRAAIAVQAATKYSLGRRSDMGAGGVYAAASQRRFSSAALAVPFSDAAVQCMKSMRQGHLSLCL